MATTTRDGAERARPGPLRGSSKRATAAGAAVEYGLTSVLLFAVVVITRLLIGPAATIRVGGLHAQLAVAGLVVGVCLACLMAAPAGRLAAGYMNPAISVAMWRFGRISPAAALIYTAVELAGSVTGVAVARLVLGAGVTRPPVLYSVLQPARGLTPTLFFVIEAAAMAVIIVCAETAGARDPRLVPIVVGAMVGLGIAVLGTVTGGSENPARQFGPAVLSGVHADLWVFLVAPLVGCGMAVAVLGVVNRLRSEGSQPHLLISSDQADAAARDTPR